MSKIAVITGITGQDGSYLLELLISKGYTVFGINRRTSSPNTSRINHILNHPNFKLYQADIGDYYSLYSVLEKTVDYDRIEIYNLGAQTQVGTSFIQPEYTTDINALGPLRILECVRHLKIGSKTYIYQASTSELYGKVVESPQKETTPFYPRSPYGVAKLYGFWIIKNYRESYGVFACNGILFNHESERRATDFVTRKITTGIKKIYTDPAHVIELGNIDAKRDWGHAEDYVRAMWLILQHSQPDDYVISTGETHSVREFIEKAFKCAGHSIHWSGLGLDEVGKDETGRIVVKINDNFYRPAEVDILLGDPSKAENTLGWKRNISFDMLVDRMVKYDLEN